VLFGLSLPDGGECGDPTLVVELGRLADESGWDGVFLASTAGPTETSSSV
jgi:hypothetical protein